MDNPFEEKSALQTLCEMTGTKVRGIYNEVDWQEEPDLLAEVIAAHIKAEMKSIEESGEKVIKGTRQIIIKEYDDRKLEYQGGNLSANGKTRMWIAIKYLAQTEE